jgi:hydroxyacylglutathione hydrolase
MPLVMEAVFTGGLAQLSYLVGDSKAGVAAVIDPRRDVDVYLELAARHQLRIAYAIETHIHADFASGACELASRTDAELIGGPQSDYGFEVSRLADGQTLGLGDVRLRALHTPGHTPEHLCLLVHDAKQGDEPFGLFTGDTLFNLDVGRPDLLGEGRELQLAQQLHRSLFDVILPLGDRIEIFPCHGAGSACGKSIGDRRQSTIGNERLYNPALQPRSVELFVDWLLRDMPEPPRHYARLKKLNAAGVPIRGAPRPLQPLSPTDLEKAAEDGGLVVDTRSILAFGGGHVPGAMNIALRDEFDAWAGWMVPDDRPVFLVGDGPDSIRQAATRLARVGLDRVAGYLHGGMTAWQNAALPLDRTPQWTVHELDARRRDGKVTILDVRSPEEVANGKVPGARPVFVPHLEDHVDEFDRSATIAVYCGTGYRASIAASVLQRRGFTDVVNVPGSWTAWRAAGLPVES